MTSASGVGSTGVAAQAAQAARPRIPRGQAVCVATLLGATAMLYLWQLGASGWANSFYTAAAQAGAHSSQAWLFGSSDGANAITVDKTPGFLWIIGLSVRLFGVNAWAILVPQALEGVAAVGVLYAAVRRTSGHVPGLIAGAVLALTPVAALMFRFNNPDALMVLLLVVAAYCVIRATEAASLRWIVASGVAVGFAFLAKELQAFTILPVLAGVYLIAAPATLRRRLAHLLAAGCAVVVSAGWYPALVTLWPTDSRPYIGGSQHNSILELTLGYNGLGRLTGDEAGGLGNTNAQAGWGRLFGSAMGDQIAWLIPAAAFLGVAALWALRRAPRTDLSRAALILWSGWLVLVGALLSFAAGIVHPYYTVELAPAIAGALGVAAPVVHARRGSWWARLSLAAAAAATGILAGVLLLRKPDWHPWLAPVLVVGSIVIAALFLLAPQISVMARAIGPMRRAGPAAASVLAAGSLAGALAAPASYSVATAGTVHHGAIPTAGPRDSTMAALPLLGGAHHHSTLLQAAPAGPRLTAMLRADAGDYTWTAATVGSNAAAGYQLSSGEPVMAIGGYNGTDPFPTVEAFRKMVADGKIHYFIGSTAGVGGARGILNPIVTVTGPPAARTGSPAPGSTHNAPPAPWAPLIGRSTAPGPRPTGPGSPAPGPASSPVPRRAHRAASGSADPAEIAVWVRRHYRAQRVDGEIVYDLTTPQVPQRRDASAPADREVP